MRCTIRSAADVTARLWVSTSTAVPRVKAELGDHPLVGRLVEFIEASRLGIVPAGTGDTDEEGGGEE